MRRDGIAEVVLDALFAVTPLGLAFVDADLRFVRVNEPLAEMNGVAVEAHLGRTLGEVLPELAPELEPLYRAVLASGEPVVEVEILGETRAEPGRMRSWVASYVPVTERGRPVGVLAIVEETTRLRRAEHEVGRLLEQIGEAFVAFDSDLRYVYANARATEIIGRPPEDVIGKLYLEEYPEAEGSTFHRAYVRALAEQQPVVFEEYWEPWDRWFENRIYPSADGLAVFFTEITGRRRVELELREANELLAALHRSAPVAISTMDVSGRVTSWSAGGQRIFGWTEAEAVGRDPVWVPDGIEVEARAVWERAASGETVVGLETQRRAKDGRLVDVSLSLAPLRAEDGTVTGIVVVGEDISERKRAAAVLQESEERLRLAAVAGGLGVWEVDLARGVVFADPATERMLGFPPGGFGGTVEEAHDQIHPDDLERVLASEQAALDDCTSYDLVFRTVGPSDELRWVQSSATVLGDEQDVAVRIVGVVVDITERTLAEEEIRRALERERESRSLLDQTLDGLGPTMFVALLDANGAVAYANRPALDVAGLTPEDVLGKAFADTYWWSYSEDVQRRLRRAIERASQGQDVRYDEVIRVGEGRYITIDFSLVGVRDPTGELLYLVPSAREITDRARAEAKLRSLTAELEARVLQRTRDVESARTEAERANAAKSEFLSRMSHELRTPLNAILGFAQLLERDGLDGERLESVEQILDAGRHLLQLVEELLDVSRIEAGMLALELEPVVVAALAQRALELVRPLADERQVVLDPLPTDAEGLVVSADRQRLLQVVLNLLSNAVKYNRAGGRVGVSWASLGDAGIEISVHDTGVGVSASDTSRIFLPFERVQGREEVEGTGLGLSVASALVEAMGGTLSVDSAPGAGSRFFFDLPLANPPLPAEAVDLGVTRTVLLIEDNVSNLRLVARTVGRLAGTRLLTAQTGSAGLALARAERPSLILLDLGLPDLPGDEVLGRLRRDPATAAIPVVVVSADVRRETIERLLAAGALDYLPKPLDVDRLLELVARF